MFAKITIQTNIIKPTHRFTKTHTVAAESFDRRVVEEIKAHFMMFRFADIMGWRVCVDDHRPDRIVYTLAPMGGAPYSESVITWRNGHPHVTTTQLRDYEDHPEAVQMLKLLEQNVAAAVAEWYPIRRRG